MGTGGPEREADHSLPSNAEVKNDGVIPLLPHTSSWRGAYLIKSRDNFTFTFAENTVEVSDLKLKKLNLLTN
jgi:hypothetical protein